MEILYNDLSDIGDNSNGSLNCNCEIMQVYVSFVSCTSVSYEGFLVGKGVVEKCEYYSRCVGRQNKS